MPTVAPPQNTHDVSIKMNPKTGFATITGQVDQIRRTLAELQGGMGPNPAIAPVGTAPTPGPATPLKRKPMTAAHKQHLAEARRRRAAAEAKQPGAGTESGTATGAPPDTKSHKAKPRTAAVGA